MHVSCRLGEKLKVELNALEAGNELSTAHHCICSVYRTSLKESTEQRDRRDR